ncbi:hypothetical protein AAHA92_03386 [Salvia divinorum]|uniref:S-protein homolog n=1 Tax=Salvia divinorum TaxID=28513 RepID=A0ABD1IGY1_SALDI
MAIFFPSKEMLLVLTFSFSLIRFGSSLSLYDYDIEINNGSFYLPLVTKCTANGKPVGAMTIKPRSSQGFKCPWLVGKRSLATCDMSLGNFRGRFDLFDSNRDLKRCNGKFCSWFINEGGLFLRIDGLNVLQYRWP